MPVVETVDDGGDTMTLMEIDGYYITNFQISNVEEQFRSLPAWKARDDDVIMTAYPKAGTHWLWEVLGMMVAGSSEYRKTKNVAMIENISQESFNKLDSPRVLNTHLHPKHLSQDFFRRRCKIVLLLRNPKDTIVSFYNHHRNMLIYNYEGSWENYLGRFIAGKVDYGGFFDYFEAWGNFMTENPDYPLHIIHYEDMLQNGAQVLTSLSDFLGLERNESFLDEINSKCRFENIKKGKSSIEFPNIWRNNKPQMYRKGIVGGWKDWFTVAQNEMLENLLQEKMGDSIFKFKY